MKEFILRNKRWVAGALLVCFFILEYTYDLGVVVGFTDSIGWDIKRNAIISKNQTGDLPTPDDNNDDDDNHDNNVNLVSPEVGDGTPISKNHTSKSNQTIIWDREFLRLALKDLTTPAPDDNLILPKVWDETPVVIENITAVIQDGRLVVNANDTYAFWHDGQTLLCQLLRNMTLTTSSSSLGTNKTNDGYSELFSRERRPLLNMTFDCLAMNEHKNQGFGQGNWVTALYQVRMATGLANVDFQFQCNDGQASRSSLLLPWFAGVFSPPTEWIAGPPSENEACTLYYPRLRIDKVADQMRDDTRRMAVDILGSSVFPLSSEDAAKYQSSHPPLISNVVLDDVVIHFRCGDVLGGANRYDFGMIAFSEYIKWIDKESTRRIGILTQPFEKELNRRRDSNKAEACREVVYLLVDYLHSHIGENVTISIHNGRNETLPLAYARLVMAKQSFTSLSSFGIFPVIGTFGEGYFQKGNRGVNPFATYIPDLPGFDNVHEMNAPRLGTGQIMKMSLNETMEWFVTA